MENGAGLGGMERGHVCQVAREGSSMAVTYSRNHHCSKQCGSLGMIIPGRRKNMCKGPETRVGLVVLRKSKGDKVASAEWLELRKRGSLCLNLSP